MVYRQDITWRQIHSVNQCIPDAGQTGNCQQTETLVPPWKSVPGFYLPHLSGAGWSRLPSGGLPAVLGVTIPDGPASAGSLSTGGDGVKVLLFSTPAISASFLILPFVGVDGKQTVPMECPAAPFPIPEAYHINWYIGIGPAFPQHIPYSPTCPEFCDNPWRWLHGLEPYLQPPRPLVCFACHNFSYDTGPL